MIFVSDILRSMCCTHWLMHPLHRAMSVDSHFCKCNLVALHRLIWKEGRNALAHDCQRHHNHHLPSPFIDVIICTSLIKSIYLFSSHINGVYLILHRKKAPAKNWVNSTRVANISYANYKVFFPHSFTFPPIFCLFAYIYVLCLRKSRARFYMKTIENWQDTWPCILFIPIDRKIM